MKRLAAWVHGWSRAGRPRRTGSTAWLGIALALPLLGGCAAFSQMFNATQQKGQSGSVVEYLYPQATKSPELVPGVTTLRPPIRVGVAFTPGGSLSGSMSEAQKVRMLDRVRQAFKDLPYVASIEVIPGQYLRPRGGFDNLTQAARLLNVEVVALLSYDQVQLNEQNNWSILYWTLVGTYVVKGDRYDVQTMMDAAVFDVASRKLLFRAPGTSQVKGDATMMALSQESRRAREEGFDRALDELLPNLRAELERFRERIKTDAAVRVEPTAAYRGGGALGPLDGVLWLVAGGLAWRAARRRAG